jgi:hypothetical protein
LLERRDFRDRRRGRGHTISSPAKPSPRSRRPCPTAARPIVAQTATAAIFVTLPRDVLDKLNYLRESGQTYSDVIIGVARG